MKRFISGVVFALTILTATAGALLKAHHLVRATRLSQPAPRRTRLTFSM